MSSTLQKRKHTHWGQTLTRATQANGPRPGHSKAHTRQGGRDTLTLTCLASGLFLVWRGVVHCEPELTLVQGGGPQSGGLGSRELPRIHFQRQCCFCCSQKTCGVPCLSEGWFWPTVPLVRGL